MTMESVPQSPSPPSSKTTATPSPSNSVTPPKHWKLPDDPSTRSILTTHRKSLANFTGTSVARSIVLLCEREENATDTALKMSSYRMGSNQVFSSPEQKLLRRRPLKLSKKDDRMLRRSSVDSSASCSSFDEEDSWAIEEMCQRFDRIFTTGTSFCASQEYQHHHHQSHGNGSTAVGAVTIHSNEMDPSSAVQIWMDHQYAEELAAKEIEGRSDDRIRQGSIRNIGDDASQGSPGSRKEESNFRHQNLWVATAQISAGTEPTTNTQENKNASAASESETTRVQGDDGDLVIEILPGVFISLLSAQDTWKAIQEGKIMVSTCLVCQEDLTSADSVQFVTCSDCWSINSIHHAERNSTKAEDERTIGSNERKQIVGIGVKNHEIVKWIEDGCS